MIFQKNLKMNSESTHLKNNLHIERFFSESYGMKNKNEFTDITITLEDGSNFHAHKLILSIASDKLKKLFLGHQYGNINMSITYNRGDIFEKMLQYIYTGDVIIETELLPALFDIGNQLEIKSLLTSEEYYSSNQTVQVQISTENENYNIPVENNKRNSNHLDLDSGQQCNKLSLSTILRESDFFIHKCLNKSISLDNVGEPKSSTRNKRKCLVQSGHYPEDNRYFTPTKFNVSLTKEKSVYLEYQSKSPVGLRLPFPPSFESGMVRRLSYILALGEVFFHNKSPREAASKFGLNKCRFQKIKEKYIDLIEQHSGRKNPILSEEPVTLESIYYSSAISAGGRRRYKNFLQGNFKLKKH